MKPIVVLFTCALLTLPAAAQPADDAEAAVRTVIGRLFDGMHAGDSTAVRSTFAPSMRLMTVMRRDGEVVVPRRPQAASWRPWERRTSRSGGTEVRVDGPLAAAWVPYAFYLGDRLSHCGTNAFQLAKLGGAWKILQITDTRRTDCGDFVPERVQKAGD